MVTPPPSPDSHVAIPDALRQQLEGFRRQLWRIKVLEAVAAGVMGLLVSFLLVYGLDRFFPTPGWMRLAILLAGVSLFGIFAPYWLHRWVWGQRRDTQLARLIARRYPGLGDRLLGVIELQNQQGSADSLSPRLREAAMQAVAGEVAQRKLVEALPPQRHRTWAALALSLAVIVVGAFLITPRAGYNALERWLFPLSKIERYTFTKLENPPDYRAVAFGEAFEITLQLAANSEQRPPEASGRYGLQAPLVSALEKNRYRFVFPGQQDPGTIVFRIGDLLHTVRVEPMPRPGLESLAAVVTPPEYLQSSERTQDLKSGVLNVVEGSKIRIDVTSDRPLASATFGPTRLQVIDDSAPAQTPYTPISGKLDISGSLAKTPVLEVGNRPFEIPLAWSDPNGLAGDTGFRLRINAVADAPPACYLQGIDRQKVLLPEETLDFELLAEDDFGIKQTGIEWSGQFTRPTNDSPAKGELLLASGAAEMKRNVQPVSYSPAAFGISPQKITLRGFTEDFFPKRGRAYSEPITLYVLSRDEHAQMLKSKFDRVITEFEDLARRELELLDESRRIDRLDGEKLQTDESIKRLENQEQAEAETERRMTELTERMENLMKDAMRNGEIDKETLKKMAEALKPMQELSQEDIPKVEGKFNDAQAPSNTPEKAEADVAKAAEEHGKAVEKMQDAIAKANEANRQFEAGTFVNRLKKAASEQSGIASTLIQSYTEILGVRPSRLDPSQQRRLQESASLQSNTASDIRWLQEDLASYFSRTKNDSFKQLLEEMRTSEIDLGLDEIRKMLGANHSFLATESAKKWADQLAKWAESLEGKKEEAGGGGGGGGQNPEDEDFEFMLRVMKLIQKEQDLRSQTRVLEQLRRDQNPAKTP